MKNRIITSEYDTIKFSTMKFSGGEVQVRLLEYNFISNASAITIIANIINSDDLMELLLLTDALKREGAKTIYLRCPYLPYARQDRVCYPGEALSLKVICDIINLQNYAAVEIWDAHSDVALALLNNVDHVEAFQLIHYDSIKNNPVLVAPDAGAIKRVNKVAKHNNLLMVTAEKIRDPKTGEITGTKINDYIMDYDEFLIVDDICDGGRTFVELAKEIRNVNNTTINLYVTHGIFSKGFDVFKGLIDNIYVANSFVDKDDLPDFVHILGE